MAETETTTNSKPPEKAPETRVAPDPALPRIRTFADDLSTEIQKKGVTTASIIEAERERAAREIALDDPAPTSKYKNPILLVGTGLLVALGAAALLGAYFYATVIFTPAPEEAASIIFPNKIVALTVPAYQKARDTLGLERFAANLSLGEIERIDLTLEAGTSTPRGILEALEAPSQLLREARSVMIGVHSFERNQPFIIIEVTQYDRSFGAMLEWEEDLGRALGNFFKPTTGTVPPTLAFTDKVVENIDVRVSQKEWPILYAFPRRDILVITTNQYTLSEILTRLNAQQNTASESRSL